ncbi:Putative Adenylate kinase [endosymbiont DhMRE of Dentiscutata heterogama]|uniref:hypothetical protein n=1 Tax=endosymbiont DhMRE of Dentiscutata heterogama TaxID=1609546 RepID=UPI000629DB16|nr:hypothetical protein [endosymbiont DhMRE of Dentiscutata heterogama]CFW92813.1 Putative Adenylate kinase [endosymbiont DhMRE of Dentiscutata heterogama]
MEIKNNSQKIILLLFPLIVNKFYFSTEEKGRFFEVGKIRKRELKEKLNLSFNFVGDQKNIASLTEKEIMELAINDYTREVKAFIQDNPHSKLTLVNYPHNEQQLVSLSAELAKIGKKINNIILINTANYELLLDLKNKYLICPICEKIYHHQEVVKENEKFICPQDAEYHFALSTIKKYNEYIIDYHLKNTESVIKRLLTANKLTPSSIIQLTVQKEEEILAGEIQKNLLKVIDSL